MRYNGAVKQDTVGLGPDFEKPIRQVQIVFRADGPPEVVRYTQAELTCG